MDGVKFAAKIEEELKNQKISKGEFYEAVGITATAMYGWKRGAEPGKKTISAVEDYLGISFADESAQSMDSDTAELLESVRNRQDLKMLFRSARDLPPSSVYEVLAEIERRKENSGDF